MSELDKSFATMWSVLTTRKGLQEEFNIFLCWEWLGIVNCTFCMLNPVASYTPEREDKPSYVTVWRFRKICEKWLLTSSCLSVRLQATTVFSLDGFSWNLILEVFGKSVEKIQILFKSDKNNAYFASRLMFMHGNISLSSSKNEKLFRQICSKNQSTRFVFSNFSAKIVSFMKQCGKVWYSRARHRWQYGSYAIHVG